MKLSLTINGAESSIEILDPAALCRFQLADGSDWAAEIAIPEPCVYSVLMEGRSYEARVEETANGLVVVLDGYRFEIEVRDPRRWTRQSGAMGGRGIQQLSAPMPGKVVRVLVSAGETVEAGQGLLVVEAMKMQNEIKAPRAGRVLSVPAKESATVTAGEILVTME
jgi:biotin carboxyl carrier protein